MNQPSIYYLQLHLYRMKPAAQVFRTSHVHDCISIVYRYCRPKPEMIFTNHCRDHIPVPYVVALVTRHLVVFLNVFLRFQDLHRIMDV